MTTQPPRSDSTRDGGSARKDTRPGHVDLHGRLSDAVQTCSCRHDILIRDAIRNSIPERTLCRLEFI